MADADAAGGDALERALVAERPRLVGLAYRITGSRVDADDVVQQAWERAQRTGADGVERPAAWFTTVVARLALDHLRSAQRRRETYVGPWLPEPVPTQLAWAQPAVGDPAEMVELAESLTFGFLRLLEALSPVERVVFVLAEVFDMPFPEVAAVVDRSPEACRQIASRARRRVRDDGRSHQAPPDAAKVADDLVVALGTGAVERVLELLAPDVVLLSDGGAAARAARRPVVGADRVSRLLLNMARRGLGAAVTFRRAELNGAPGMVALAGDTPILAMAAMVEDGKVSTIYSVVNPDKLAALRLDDLIA
ncbi:MAG TPA: RNA polymerase sigma factor SigJ [Acidimicrobiales bacterium]|nr:RNA polymerase sigma factor SigJ [Acidimicrobiales bacterium]